MVTARFISAGFVSSLRSLPAAINAQPSRIFWYFAFLHLVLWTVLPALTSPNAPLDVIEGYAWGREWLWGTYKHPPMQAWILEILVRLIGRTSWTHFLTSQLAVITAFWAVWQTGRRIVGEPRALIAVLLLEGVIYYNYTSTEFNPNVLQLTFWALAGWSFHRAVKDDRLIDWLLLGVWAAMGLCTKYSTILLLGVFAVLIAVRPEARRCLKKPGPYLAVLTALLLLVPHFVWLWRHDFLPFVYVTERLTQAGPATRYVKPPHYFPALLLSPTVFIVSQILALLPASLLLLTLDNPPETKAQGEIKEISNFDKTFLAAITFVPMLLTLIMAISFGFKVHDMWGTPFFNFASLWAVTKFYPKGIDVRPRFVYAWTVVFGAALLALVSANLLSPYNLKPMRIHFPGKALARNVENRWNQQIGAPLSYVIGDTWLAGNVAFYAKSRPHVLIDDNFKISPWINKDELAQGGAVVVWCLAHCSNALDAHGSKETEPAFLHEQYPQAKVQEPLVLPRQTDADLPAVTIGWAIVPPKAGNLP